ncbi:hypothetical protein A6770_23150 [Nostoc minutum NIES-26]|uniref:Uncharacterized protein n=1 Tax=Nostoc minutum NIES-26 TaxID=1844469 RepID=A0A367QWR5_9NOSO|nr:hypothetical protein A6770_23150 [Nostoc minutum NIES-26]
MTYSKSAKWSFDSICEDIKHIKEFLQHIPMWRFFLSPIKSNCRKVRNLVGMIENQLNEQIDLINQFHQSLKNCQELTSKVLVAREKAHKAALIISEGQTKYNEIFTNDMETSYGAISAEIDQLPIPKGSELEKEIGKLDSLLKSIRDSIRDLKNCNQDDVKTAKELFHKIATNYTDMQQIMSKVSIRFLQG